jgi:vacuolar-type H+-ATPase subunit I/STV1
LLSIKNEAAIHEDEFNIDDYLEDLAEFLRLDEKKLDAATRAFNKEGTNISLAKLSNLFATESEDDALITRDSMAILVHYHQYHKREFNESASKSKMDGKIIQSLKNWIKKLDKNGLQYLERLYSAFDTEGRPSLQRIDYRLSLTETINDESRRIGYLPVIRIDLGLIKEYDEEVVQSIYLPLDNFNALIYTLKEFQAEAMRSVDNFRKKLGESVIYAKD